MLEREDEEREDAETEHEEQTEIDTELDAALVGIFDEFRAELEELKSSIGTGTTDTRIDGILDRLSAIEARFIVQPEPEPDHLWFKKIGGRA